MTLKKEDLDIGEGTKSSAEDFVLNSMASGNLALAEIKAREMFADESTHARAFNFLGCIAVLCGLAQQAVDFFRTAHAIAPDWQEPEMNLTEFLAKMPKPPQRNPSPAFLLIKSWGAGFWSDVSHVIGQALLAEMTNRTPIVHWGNNSLYWSGNRTNAFDAFFEPIADLTIEAVKYGTMEIWPPKWKEENLFTGEIDKWHGEFSRLSGIYLLGRQEALLVSDFYTSVFDLTLWIPRSDPKHAMRFDELYTYLLRKYLRPKREIVDIATTFFTKHFREREFIAVHARGSDKNIERPNLNEINSAYHAVIEEFRDQHATPAVFLMTDDANLLDDYIKRYGSDVVFTDCTRSSTSQGVHLANGRDPERLGIEVMVDAFVAVRGAAFIGNGASNLSQMVRYLGSWSKENVCLLGDDIYRQQNEFLHKT